MARLSPAEPVARLHLGDHVRPQIGAPLRPVLVERPGLLGQVEAVLVQPRDRPLHVDLDQPRSRPLQQRHRLTHDRGQARVGVLEEEALGHADRAPLDPVVQRVAVARNRQRLRTRIVRRRPGQHLQRQRRIAHRPGHRTAVVERRAERLDPRQADPPEGRLQPNDPAYRRGAADRAAGVGARRQRHDAGRQGRSRSAARPARDASGVVRVAAGAEPGVVACHAPRQLVGVQLGDADGTGGGRPGDHIGIALGYVIAVDGAAVGGADAAGVDQILPADRHARERTRVAPRGHRRVHRGGLPQRPLFGHQPDRAQLVGAGPVKRVAGDLRRRNVARANRRCQVGRVLHAHVTAFAKRSARKRSHSGGSGRPCARSAHSRPSSGPNLNAWPLSPPQTTTPSTWSRMKSPSGVTV